MIVVTFIDTWWRDVMTVGSIDYDMADDIPCIEIIVIGNVCPSTVYCCILWYMSDDMTCTMLMTDDIIDSDIMCMCGWLTSSW